MAKAVLFLILTSIFLSCGKQSFPDYKSEEDATIEVQSVHLSGMFVPLNGSRMKAEYLTWTEKQQIYFRIKINHYKRNVRVQQYLNKGSRCPGPYSDLDGNSVIDFEEIQISSGEMLMPLDKKLNSQLEGSEWFPETDNEGNYYYSRSGALFKIMEDLTEDDTYVNDGLGKLSKGEKLNLESRTIILFGDGDNPLKPVACAEI